MFYFVERPLGWGITGEVEWGGGPVGPAVLDTRLDRIPRMERTGRKPVRPMRIVRDGLTPEAEAQA